jgi:SAM-dependent methyltransferase
VLRHYYGRRAREYERIYHRDDPARQSEQTALATDLQESLRGRSVLEIACGTGFWTEIASRVARHVVAVDASPEMLAVAQEKGPPPGRVEFKLGDAYELDDVPGVFDGGLAMFWLSHVPKARLSEFLDGWHEKLGRGSIVFMADNVYVPGVGGELLVPSSIGDTFKLRTLSDGSQHRVLKNYYDASFLHHTISPAATDLRIHVGECFWWLRYTL